MFSINLDNKFKTQDFYWELPFLHQQWLVRAWAKAKQLHKGNKPEYYILGHKEVALWLIEKNGQQVELYEIESIIKKFCSCCE